MKTLFFVFMICLSSVIYAEKTLQPAIDDGMDITQKLIQYYSPHAFDLWKTCQEEGVRAYNAEPLSSCSIEGHKHAKIFNDFIKGYLKGAVLDIGCGPQDVPLYLKGYPISQIVGIDPIGEQKDHPFVFYKGFAEYLPWENETFDIIVIGTSLDHVILLDKVISELQRVLKPTGRLIIWTSFVKNTKLYNPYDPNFKPFDKFHLFHFSESWFNTVFREKFYITRKLALSPNESFYIFAPKNVKREAFLHPYEVEQLISQ